jgi:heat shock protein HtpX
MFIVNPLSGGSFRSLFSTHPPIEERVARLSGTRPQTPTAPHTGSSGAESGKAFWDRMSGN